MVGGYSLPLLHRPAPVNSSASIKFSVNGEFSSAAKLTDQSRSVDSVNVESTSPEQVVSPLLSFDGLKASQNKLFFANPSIPPDTEGDVGLNNYVQSVNTIFAIYSKTGSLVAGPYAENALFAAVNNPYCGQPADNGGDPIVKYDAPGGRWFFSYLSYPNGPSHPPFYWCTAVSQSSDPTGAWYLFAWVNGGDAIDYPKVGVWPNGFYVTFNSFNFTNNPATGYCNPSGSGCFDGVGVWVLNRQAMEINALSTPLGQFFLIPPGQGASYGCDFSLLPSDLNGALLPPNNSPVFGSAAPNLLAELQYGAGCIIPAGFWVWSLSANWFYDNSTLTRSFGFGASNWYDPYLGPIPEPSPAKASYACPYPNQALVCGDYLDPISDRLMYRLQYRNLAGGYQSILMEHTVDENGKNHAGIRWYELRNYGSGWGLWQFGDYAPDSNNRWMGSIAQDSTGNIALCYSVSSTVTFPSIRCTAHLTNDPSGQMTQPEIVIMNGMGSQVTAAPNNGGLTRWGDYSALQLDPVDDLTFWYTNEYYPSSGTYQSPGWSTRIGSFTLASLVSYAISLNSGWNLISLPLVPANTATSAVLASLISSKDLVSMWQFTGGKTGTWVSFVCYSPGSCSGQIYNMVDGVGYWIFVSFPATLQVTGYIVRPASLPSSYSLPAGWNLVGFKPQPNIISEPLSQYLSSLSNSCNSAACYDPTNIWIYNNVQGQWIHASSLSQTIAPGQAFWILMNSAGTLNPA